MVRSKHGNARGHHKKRAGTSRAQQQFLASMYAQKAEDAKKNCDCPGCPMCKGHVPGCVCDIDLSGLYLRKAHSDAGTACNTDTGDGQQEPERGTTHDESASVRYAPDGAEPEGYPF